MSPTVAEELELEVQGFTCIAGLDEVGRGSWAGPVVAAAVVLGPRILANPTLLAGTDDSKRLSEARREQLAGLIATHVQAFGIGAVPAFLIDCFGIAHATRLAMQLALLALPCLPDALLIDALRLPLSQPQRSLVRGDSRSLSIAAASIIAKVSRDRLMRQMEHGSAVYGFAEHKGYGTAVHYAALRRFGPSNQHRRSFRPISTYVECGAWPK